MSLRPFRAVTFTVLLAGLALNIISSPVNGLMPLRALTAGFFLTVIFSMPGNVTFATDSSDVSADFYPVLVQACIAAARTGEADLIVMGCYGHSAFRESLFGGATYDLLEDMKRPVLMAH